MLAQTAEKRFQAPQASQMDETTQHLNDFALEFTSDGCVQFWDGYPQTGEYEGVEVFRAGEGIVASSWVKREE